MERENKRYSKLTKREKVRYIFGKLSLVFFIIFILMVAFIFIFSGIMNKRKISVCADVNSTDEFFYSVFNDVNNLYGVGFPYTLNTMDGLFDNLPQFRTQYSFGNSKRFQRPANSYDFDSSIQDEENYGTYQFYTKTFNNDTGRIGAYYNLPYRFFSINSLTPGSLPVETFTQTLLVWDELTDGSVVCYQYFFVLNDYGSSITVCLRPGVSVDLSSTATPLDYYDMTIGYIDTVSQWHSLFGYQTTFTCFNKTSTGTESTVFILPGLDNVSERTLFFHGNFVYSTYQFLDSSFFSGEYYGTLWSSVKNLIIDTATVNTQNLIDIKNKFTVDVQELNAKYDSLLLEYKTYYDLYLSYYNQYISLEFQYDNLVTQNNDLGQENDHLTEAFNSLSSDYTFLNNEFQKLTTSFDSLETDFTSLQNEYIQLETDYRTLNIDNSQLQEEFNTTSSNLATLQSLYDELVLANEDLEVALQTVRDKAFQDGVDSVKAMNDVLTVVPNTVVDIWNGVLAPVFRFDIAGVSLGLYLAGILVIGISFWLLTKFL